MPARRSQLGRFHEQKKCDDPYQPTWAGFWLSLRWCRVVNVSLFFGGGGGEALIQKDLAAPRIFQHRLPARVGMPRGPASTHPPQRATVAPTLRCGAYGSGQAGNVPLRLCQAAPAAGRNIASTLVSYSMGGPCVGTRFGLGQPVFSTGSSTALGARLPKRRPMAPRHWFWLRHVSRRPRSSNGGYYFSKLPACTAWPRRAADAQTAAQRLGPPSVGGGFFS